MAIFKCIDDSTTGPRLRSIQIDDADLVKYIVNRARGASKETALQELLNSKPTTPEDAEFIRELVEQFPINTRS